jgi:hypothetical protein
MEAAYMSKTAEHALHWTGLISARIQWFVPAWVVVRRVGCCPRPPGK